MSDLVEAGVLVQLQLALAVERVRLKLSSPMVLRSVDIRILRPRRSI